MSIHNETSQVMLSTEHSITVASSLVKWIFLSHFSVVSYAEIHPSHPKNFLGNFDTQQCPHGNCIIGNDFLVLMTSYEIVSINIMRHDLTNSRFNENYNVLDRSFISLSIIIIRLYLCDSPVAFWPTVS